MRDFNYIKPATLNEVSNLLDKYRDKAKVLAGGTDLISTMKNEIKSEYPELIISLNGIENLSYIREDDGVFKIGALTTLYDLEQDLQLKEKYPILVEAAHRVASPNIRNIATIGGNICQEPRCWYYRKSNNRFPCIRKGGKECYALYGENQYHSIFGGASVDTPPCSQECPANIDIPAYLDEFRKGNIVIAAKILLKNNPIPAVTGRVCPHFCQNACARELYDSPVSIRSIERFLGDYILNNSDYLICPPLEENEKKIAIIGSGPAGLSAAYYLRQLGYKITVFERKKEIGGLLTYGIPPYRLPKDILEKIVQAFKKIKIDFRTEVNIGEDISIEDLIKDYDYVFLASGAWIERSIGIEGEELAISGISFLENINSRNRKIYGKKIAVVGGGNSAIDIARLLIRLGVEPTILYRRREEDMPAIKEEIIKAKEEGVKFKFLTVPIKILRNKDLLEVECSKMRLGNIDKTGRPLPEKIEGSEYKDYFNAIIKSVGQVADTSIVPLRFFSDQGHLKLGVKHYQIGENLFAGGDFITGPSTAVSALDTGRKVAYEIHKIQTNVNEKKPIKDDRPQYNIFSGNNLMFSKSIEPLELSLENRRKNIDLEDISGLDIGQIKEEINRCFNCSCVAVSPSDIGPALITLEATIKTNKRSIKSDNFFKARVGGSTVLDQDEVVTEIILPQIKPNTKQVYLKFAVRKTIDFNIVSVAVVITYDERGKKVNSARIVLGGVAPIPLNVQRAADFLKGKNIEEEIAEKSADMVVKSARALVQNDYKIQITKSLLKRVILKLKP